MRTISPEELREKTESGQQVTLVDVREAWEHEAYNIGGTLVPMSELASRFNEIPRDKDVVIYCEKGIRSVIVIQRLEAAGFTNLINLSGGVKAWRDSERLG